MFVMRDADPAAHADEAHPASISGYVMPACCSALARSYRCPAASSRRVAHGGPAGQTNFAATALARRAMVNFKSSSSIISTAKVVCVWDCKKAHRETQHSRPDT
jgi:hypothetical protein